MQQQQPKSNLFDPVPLGRVWWPSTTWVFYKWAAIESNRFILYIGPVDGRTLTQAIAIGSRSDELTSTQSPFHQRKPSSSTSPSILLILVTVRPSTHSTWHEHSSPLLVVVINFWPKFLLRTPFPVVGTIAVKWTLFSWTSPGRMENQFLHQKSISNPLIVAQAEFPFSETSSFGRRLFAQLQHSFITLMAPTRIWDDLFTGYTEVSFNLVRSSLAHQNSTTNFFYTSLVFWIVSWLILSAIPLTRSIFWSTSSQPTSHRATMNRLQLESLSIIISFITSAHEFRR